MGGESTATDSQLIGVFDCLHLFAGRRLSCMRLPLIIRTEQLTAPVCGLAVPTASNDGTASEVMGKSLTVIFSKRKYLGGSIVFGSIE